MKIAAGLIGIGLAAAPTVYPPEVQLFGVGAAQTVVVEGEGCTLRVEDGGVAEWTGGRVVARGKGATWLTVKCESGVSTAPVVVRAASVLLKKSYVNDVAPLLTLKGCTSGNCHGSAQGRGGLKLSLYGRDPAMDFVAVGKRIDAARPEKSLVLLKATAETEHGGGRRFVGESFEYRTIVDWVREGGVYDSPGMRELRVYPRERILVGQGAVQQMVAVGYFTDGTVRDMTREAGYSVNDPEVAEVNGTGEARALQTGETAVMARAGGLAAAGRILVAASKADPAYVRVARNGFVDEHVFAKLQRLNIRPSGESSDGEFLRRVWLDTIGRLPAEEEARSFLVSRATDKRRLMIDQLLGRPEFGAVWAPPLPEDADGAGRMMLGIRIGCARCHDHPWDQWKRADFQGLAAFFESPEERRVVPKYPDGPRETGDDARAALARWMKRADNSYFARATVNRVWKQLFGRGLVEDVDDMRATNPSTNPALLEALAADFVRSRNDVRRLVRTILLSRTYQLSGRANETNREDTTHYSHAYRRRLAPAVLAGMITQVTGVAGRAVARENAVNSTSRRGSVCERDARRPASAAADDSVEEQLAAARIVIAGDAAEALYLRTLTRFPTAGERERVEKALRGGERETVLRDLLWALLRSDEFIHNH